MDPFSIATGSLALAGTITKVGISLTTFVREVRDARNDVDGVSAELNSLKTILELIVEDVEAATNPMPPLLKTRIEAILSSCSQAVNEIEVCVGRHQGSRVQKGMRWATMGKGEMAKLQSTLEANKATLSLALDMISITTLQEVKHTTEEIQSTTSNIYRDTGDIKDDTARILQAITELQARLPPDENPRFNMLQRYLDELSTYAESVIDDIDHHPVLEEFLHEDTAPWVVGTDISSTTFVEGEDNIQDNRHNKIPSVDRLYIHDPTIEYHSSHLHSPPGNEGSPSRGPNRQGGDDFDNEKIGSTIMREKGSRQKRVRILTSDPATHAGDNLPTTSENQAANTHQLQYNESIKPTLEDFEGPFTTPSTSLSNPSGGASMENDQGFSYCEEARNLDRIIGLPHHFIPHEESTTIEPCDSVRPWSAFFVPNALLDCALLVNDTIKLLGQPRVRTLLEYLLHLKYDMTELNPSSMFSVEMVAKNLWMGYIPSDSRLKNEFFREKLGPDLKFVFAIAAVIRFLDKLPHTLIPSSCIEVPKAPRFTLSSEIPLKRRVKAAQKTLSLIPASIMGITVVILRLFTQCEKSYKRRQYIEDGESMPLLDFFVDRLFEGDDRAAHLEFFTFIIRNAKLFDNFLYKVPRTYTGNIPDWAMGI